MAQQLLCDLGQSCPVDGRVIAGDAERMDVYLTSARRTALGEPGPDMMNFHLDCWAGMPAVVPSPGVSVTIRHVAPPPAEVPAAS
ncbi:hypothetical protein [Streptomyces laurentii]|uniref:hypothetical protein n=1 Tax=Streptomyces laurentii TaxID=39478 RepID=UPI003683B20D